MPAKRYRESTIEWALGRLRAIDGAEPKKPVARPVANKAAVRKAVAEAKPVLPPALARMVDRFGLEDVERRAIELAFAAEVSFEVARAARALSGGRGLTVEIVREALGLDGAAAARLFAAEGSLRARGLIVVDAVPGGSAGAQADLVLASGVAAQIEGRAPGTEALAAGVARIDPPSEKLLLSEPLAELIREDVADQKPRWVTVAGAGTEEARVLAQAIARRLGRGVIFVDGASFDGLEARLRHAACAALRREADLSEAPIVVTAAAALGGAFRALGVPPAPGAGAPPCIVLLDEQRPPAGRPDPAFAVRERSLAIAPAARFASMAAATAASPSPSPTTPAPAAPSPVSEAIDRARRQGAMDAARAMGRPIPLPPPTVQRAASPSTSPPLATAAAVLPPSSAAPRSASESARPVEPANPAPPADAPPKPRPEDIVGPMRPARERGAARSASPPRPVDPTTQPEAAKSAAPAVPPVAADAAAAARLADPGAPAAPADPAEALPFLDVSASASATELAQLIPRVPNPLQRANLINRLAAQPRDMATVAVIRAHLKVEHAGLRSAAEEAMATLFGPNWNKSRAIPKPVQPPHSDDGGKPPG